MTLQVTQYRATRQGREAVCFVVNSFTLDQPPALAQVRTGINVKLLVVELPDGSKIGINFRHDIYRKKGEDGKPRAVFKTDPKTSDRPFSGVCICEAYKMSGQKSDFLTSGWSVCKQGDNYDKRIARKVALKHLLAKVGPGKQKYFTRNDRIVVWNAYWKYIGPQEVKAKQPPPTPITPAPIVQAAKHLDRLPKQDVSGNPIPMM